jgi:hypothetical protein
LARRTLANMSDACDYFQAHAVEAVRKARRLPVGRAKQKQRTVARVYHLLAKEAAYAPNIHHLEDFRAARRLEARIDRVPSARHGR